MIPMQCIFSTDAMTVLITEAGVVGSSFKLESWRSYAARSVLPGLNPQPASD